MKVDSSLSALETYVDADFVGNWNPKDAHPPASVASRTAQDDVSSDAMAHQFTGLANCNQKSVC